MTIEPRYSSRRIMITGGASGFGLAATEALLQRGANVAIGDIDKERLRQTEGKLNSQNLLTVELDVTSPESVQRAMAACHLRFGGLDGLVNSAGVIWINALSDISEEEWDKTIDVNLKGTFLCCQKAVPLLRKSQHGRIVNIGSDASKVGFPMIPHYCASKFGVVGLTKSLAGELAPHKITVNCVCPVGVMDTNMGKGVLQWKMETTGLPSEEILARAATNIPLKRNATTADIVNAILFFLADSSDFLTGVALDVDGGSTSTVPIPGTT